MSKILGYEFRTCHHVPATNNNVDTHIIKDITHYEDGTTKSNFRFIENYKRPFWITKKLYRIHKQHREAEKKEKLQEFSATESELPNAIFKAFGKQKFNKVYMRDVRRASFSPYVYGADTQSGVLIRIQYKENCDIVTPYAFGVLDIENNVDTREISLISYVHIVKDRMQIHLSINPNLIDDVPNIKIRILERLRNGLPDVLPEGFTMETSDFFVKVYNDELDLIRGTIAIVHESDIDILTGWNFHFDISTIADRLDLYGVDPKDVFSDPRVPENLRFFKIIKGREEKVMQSGKSMPLPPEERWHVMKAANGFEMIDSMATYKFIRQQEAKIQGGYNLNNVLTKSIGIGKLNLVDLGDVSGYDYHKTMSTLHQIDYSAYSIWDSAGLTCKHLKDRDMDISLPLLSDISPFDYFNSGPSRIYDDFYKTYQDEDKVIAIKRDYGQIEEPESLGRENWTVTLNLWKVDTDYAVDNRNEEYTGSLSELTGMLPDDRNAFRSLGYFIPPHGADIRTFSITTDIDVSSAYPTSTSVLNISNDTVMREVISIGNIDKEEFKIRNMDLITGPTSHMRYCEVMFNKPTLFELEQIAIEEFGLI